MKSVLFNLLAISLLLLGLAIPAHSVDLIPHKAIYKSDIKKGVKIKGTATRELKQLKDNQWLYRFEVESFVADIAESVVFSWEDQRIRPMKYDYLLSGFFIKDRYQKVQFDWESGQAAGKHDGKNWELKLLDNSIDRLGYQLQLLVDVEKQSLQHSPALMNYEIVHRGLNRPSTFEIVGTEQLKTKRGTWETTKVVKKRDKGGKRKTDLWFSKKYPFLLLKMVQIEKDGERYELNLNSAESLGKKIY